MKMSSQITYDVCILSYEGLSKDAIENKFLNRLDQEEYKITVDVDLPVDAGVKSKVKFQYWTYPHNIASDNTKWEEQVIKKIEKSKGIIIFYDLTSIESLTFIGEKIQVLEETLKVVPPILLVGNELDLDKSREVSEEHIQNFQESRNISSSIELSLTTGENVEKTFLKLAEIILRTSKPDYRVDAKRISIKRIMSHKRARYAFLILLFMFVASVVGSVIMYFIL
jgi:GTPase SAR1 family protein